MNQPPLMRQGEIREACAEDAEQIIAHLKQIADETPYHTFVGDEFQMQVDQQINMIESIKNVSNSVMIVCLVEGAIIGVLTLMGGNRSKSKHAATVGISIKLAYCGYGIGHHLMAHLEGWIKRGDIIKKINLVVHEDNIRAIKFYEELGFIHEGRSTMYFYDQGRYYDGIHMGKSMII